MVVFAFRAWWLGRKLPKLVPGVGKPDVVIGSSPHLLTPLAACLVAQHYGVPFVVEVRDLWPQTIIDMGELSPRHPITKALQVLERFLYHQSERIITVLPLAREYISTCGISKEKIVWIPNGADISKFRDVKPIEKDSHDFKIMYAGAHGQNDALEGLIRAARIVQDRGFSNVRFILVGNGPAKASLIKLAKDLELSNVEFRNAIPKDQVPRVLGEANATVLILYDLPLYKYGISANKIFDYLAAGKPLILAGKPANNPIEEAQCGLTVPPQDPEALAEAIVKLYQMSPEERAKMGKRGREYVEKHHDIRKLAAHLEEVLHSLVAPS
jgi:glycosyltransferase involved in cell wall biosynthesis